MVEVLITMLLTVIVFSIAFLSYRIIQQQLNDFTRSSDELLEYVAFQSAMDADIRKALYLEVADDGFYAARGDSAVSYRLLDSLVIRENAAGVIDSFMIHVTGSAFFFQNTSVELEGALFDCVVLSFSENGQDYVAASRKEYDALTLMNIKTEME